MKSKTKYSKLIIYTIIVLLIILFFLIYFKYFNGGDLFNKPKPIKVSVPDRCGLILGNLLHEIASKEDCDLRCFNECNIRKLEKDKSEFSSQVENTSCYSCDCYCK